MRVTHCDACRAIAGWLLCVLLAGCSHNPSGTNPFAPPAYGAQPPTYGTPPAAYGAPPNVAAPPAAAPSWGAPGYPPPPAAGGVAPPGAAPYAAPNMPPPGAAADGRPFPSIKRPSWGSPGTINQQQQQAIVHDPFADNDAGPEIVGGRPRDFQKPLAQPARDRPFGNLRWPF